MTTDRELLELAAKAAGLSITGRNKRNSQHVAVLSDGSYWQPLFENSITDTDGDALRLAVRLGITIGPESPDVIGKSLCRASWNNRRCSLGEYGDGDIYAATRRAIVRAAAEIGRAME